MPKIKEIFGYPLEDTTTEANQCRREAKCPFMNAPCDGGGNRYLSQVNLSKNPDLASLFSNNTTIPAGICSIQLHPDESPWIVCPRRLMVLKGEHLAYQDRALSLLLNYSDYATGTLLGVWSEVKLKHETGDKSFDYTFDYILMPVGRVSATEVEQATQKTWAKIKPILEKAGYQIIQQEGSDFITNFPLGMPLIVEIMTSSTSGGNQKHRSTIPLAFEDALLGKSHTAPGINYRQVWARMVSQLIVKSEVANFWGGKTIWVLQDVLVDYISRSTALNILELEAQQTSEVNILSLGYGESDHASQGVQALTKGSLYSGKIRPEGINASESSFVDIIRTPICPPKEILMVQLARRTPVSYLRV